MSFWRSMHCLTCTGLQLHDQLGFSPDAYIRDNCIVGHTSIFALPCEYLLELEPRAMLTWQTGMRGEYMLLGLFPCLQLNCTPACTN